MGGSSQAQYPAAMLGDLWQNEIGSFAVNQPLAQQGYSNANYAMVSPYGMDAFAQGLAGTAEGLIPSVMSTAFDPQQALYNQLFTQQQQQGAAANAMSGVATTPYGASLSQQGNQNFDINWQNQQLARQAQGVQTAGNLANMGMGALGQDVSSWLNFINTSNQGASGLWNAINQSFQAANQMYGTEAQSQTAANQQKASGLGGLGQLAGGVMGLLTP